jgi:signal transduction histidine kinase
MMGTSNIGRMPGITLVVLGLLSVASGYLTFEPSYLSALWLLAGLLLEATAVHYPGLGIYTGAVALYLSGACFADFGATGVLLALVLGAVARASSSKATGKAAYDVVIHGIPCLAAALVPVFWRVFLDLEPYLIAYLLTLVVYYLVDELVNRRVVFSSLRGETRISWMRLRRSVVDIRAGIAVAGLILLVGSPLLPWLPLAFVPILWMTHKGMRNAIFRIQAMLAAEMEQQAKKLSRDLESTRGELVHTEQERAHLQQEVGQLSVVLRSARVLGSELQQKKLLDLAHQLAEEEFGADSGLLIWDEIEYAWGPTQREVLIAKKAPNTFYCTLPKEGKDFGHLYFQWENAPKRDKEFQQLLETFAFSLGLALENASRYKQVVEVQKQLVESSKLRAIGQLAAGVAHELNSPLGAVRLALEALATQELGERGQKRVKRAHDACGRALTIVDKLLIYSREKKRAPKPFSCRDVIEDTLIFLRSNLQTEGVHIETDLASEAQVLGVSGEIQQILINLILNAAQATRQAEEATGGIEIRTADAGESIDIFIADQGAGVPLEIQDRIFEPFFTTKEIGQGTGLGLSISQEIAMNHGGSLELVPSEKGATFRIRLPKV